ncbi:hypothetical protein [Methanopyrus sp.]
MAALLVGTLAPFTPWILEEVRVESAGTSFATHHQNVKMGGALRKRPKVPAPGPVVRIARTAQGLDLRVMINSGAWAFEGTARFRSGLGFAVTVEGVISDGSGRPYPRGELEGNLRGCPDSGERCT